MSASAQRGSDTSARTRRGDDSWEGQRDTGSAFRGISRGRGRGRGAPRGRQGGRGAGWRSVSTRTALPELKSTPPPLPEKPGAAGEGPATKSSTPSKSGREFPKVPSRPNLTLDSQTSQKSDAISPASPNKPSRRRRNTHNRSVSAALPKPIPTSLTDGLPTSSSTPLMPPSKDAKVLVSDNEKNPDPSASVHDLRKDIKDLVDHVRNMAMESNRPNSPSTHIDWAGEEDDSLPDLDDWGVSSKLTSDVGEISINGAGEPPSEPEISPIPAPVLALKQNGAKGHAVAELVTVDGTQSSAESPTESSMSLTVPPPVKRVRERRRVSNRRDKERRAAQLNTSKDVAVPPTKKSLLERLGSPIRPEAPALPGKPSKEQNIFASMSELGLPPHSSLPPKPSSLPKKPPLPVKVSASPKKSQHDVSPPKGTVSLSSSGSNASTSNLNGSTNSAERQSTVHPIVSKTAETTKPTKESSFDWSEDPVSFKPIPTDGPSVDVEPATPLDNNVTQPPGFQSGVSLSQAPDITDTKSDAPSAASPRFRSQRPLSGDATPTPRTRRERSPYKTHNPRNYSAPNSGSGSPGVGRSPGRPQHASRPIIRMDALAMITRSLRESPTPPRRDSPLAQ